MNDQPPITLRGLVAPPGDGAAPVGAPSAAGEEPAAAKPAWGPRGGGGRGRTAGGKWGGLDPVMPITKAGILDSLDAFYGFAADAPIRDHLVCAAHALLPRRLASPCNGAGGRDFLCLLQS